MGLRSRSTASLTTGKLVPILERRGYGSEDVANVMYGNWHVFYTSYLP